MFPILPPGAATAFGVPAYARSGRKARKAMRIRLSNGLLMPRLLGVESIAKNRKSQTAPSPCAGWPGVRRTRGSLRAGGRAVGGTTPRGGRRTAQQFLRHGQRRSPRLLEIRSISAGGKADSWRLPRRTRREFPAPVVAHRSPRIGKRRRWPACTARAAD